MIQGDWQLLVNVNGQTRHQSVVKRGQNGSRMEGLDHRSHRPRRPARDHRTSEQGQRLVERVRILERR
jgi:hypothetical protein